MKRSFFALILFLGFFGSAQSQDTLGVTVDSIGLTPNPVPFDSAFSFSFNIVNTGSNFFTGQYSIILAIDTGNLLPNLMVIDTMPAFDSLNPGESSTYVFSNVIVNAARFASGGNGVSVWPEAQTIHTSDTLRDNLVVTGSPNGINEPKWEGYSSTILYPNPTKDRLFIQSLGTKTIADQVRIYNITGSIQASISKTNIIDLSNYQAGVYMIQVILSGDRVKTFQVVKH